MALRRREKRTPQSKLDATPPWDIRQRAEPKSTTGPFDILDAPEDELNRIDLGGLRIPAAPGMEVRLDLNESQQVMSVTLASQSGSMQLGVFAAPRAQGIWDEVREEISASVSEQGGSVKAAQSGPFGAELVGQLQVDGQLTPVRFIGVDGPRWFLRAMLVGAVAADRSLAKAFENVFRAVVVVRGPDPLPVRDQVPLSLPPEALPDGGGTVEDGQAGADRDPAGPDRPDAADRTAR